MRLRNVKNAESIVAESSYSVNEPENYKGHFKDLFGNDNPIYIEIGMGKGDFIIGMAKKYPDINFVGIEAYSSVMVRAIQKLDDMEEIPNLKLINKYAEFLGDIFDHEVDTIYLNFSDPWPKTRHAKRRLTHENALKVYDLVFKGNLRDFFFDRRESLSHVC